MTPYNRLIQKEHLEAYVDIDFISQFLGLPIKTIYKWSSESSLNGFPCYKLGRRLKFKISEIERWIRKYKKGGC